MNAVEKRRLAKGAEQTAKAIAEVARVDRRLGAVKAKRSNAVSGLMAREFSVSLKVPGAPIPKGRPRFGGGRTYTPPRTRAYEKDVSEMGRIAMMLAGAQITAEPLTVDIVLTFPIAKSWPASRKAAALDGTLLPTTTPDADNCAKSILDGLQGVVFENDGQVIDLHVSKKFGEYGSAVVSIRSVKPSIKLNILDF